MITLKTATKDDIGTILDLWKEFHVYQTDLLLKKEPSFKPHLAKKDNAKEIYKKYVFEKIESGKGKVLLAMVKGKTAGMCFFFIEDTIPVFKMEKIGYLGDLFVRDEFRNMGVSSLLRKEAFKWFRKKGMTHTALKVYKENAHAYSIYLKWGFKDFIMEMRRKL